MALQPYQSRHQFNVLPNRAQPLQPYETGHQSEDVPYRTLTCEWPSTSKVPNHAYQSDVVFYITHGKGLVHGP